MRSFLSRFVFWINEDDFSSYVCFKVSDMSLFFVLTRRRRVYKGNDDDDDDDNDDLCCTTTNNE